MKKTGKIYMMSQLNSSLMEESIELLKDWLSFVRIITEPKYYKIDDGETLPFDSLAAKSAIEDLTDKDTLWMKIYASEGEFQVHISSRSIVERNIIDSSVFFKYQKMIENYNDLRMEASGIYGYIRSLDEYLYNNVEKMDKRDFDTAEELTKLPKRYNNNQEIIVDCNQFSGYDIFFRGLCLTACWKMYYSSLYFQIIPRQIFLEVQQVQTIEELKNDMVKVSLFLDPLNWQAEANQHFQQFFRAQMGFDQLAWNNGVGILRPPLIEFAFIEEMVQTVQYQNDRFQPVEKKKATYFVTRSSDYIRQEYSENRTKGVLNVQAYFPWIDHQGKKMMNYRVINPQLAIDAGLAAYEFYIRQYLEIHVADEKYDTYLAVLRFYLPKASLAQVPLDELQEKLWDVNISNLVIQDSATYFDLRKDSSHLRVAFVNADHLEIKDLEKIDEME
ncbi:hypothetical protein [Enterococcus sp. BWR-S5]|uniref:hypothetical protein n=1 Tax=Enterococcus sp. BWR-S5 TaxID=2787714 RepID=UPI001922E91A|nr:hypothetical protein [Enterococcus sp. BWR-S5]MBL1225219.1 hypothetical protein [Enterococcus sp. BWR-S5]